MSCKLGNPNFSHQDSNTSKQTEQTRGTIKKVDYSAYLSSVHHSNSVENNIKTLMSKQFDKFEVRFVSIDETQKYSTENSGEFEEYKSI